MAAITPTAIVTTKVTMASDAGTITRHPGVAYRFYGTSDPNASNDGTQGYQVGDIWVNTSTDITLSCVDASTGAAVWNTLLDSGDIGVLVLSTDQPYGMFSHSANQTVAVINTAYAAAFNTDELKNDITHSTVTNNSRITVDKAGTYLIAVSAIVDLTAGANKHFNLWLRIDGTTDVPRSNTIVQITTASIEMTLAVTFLYTFTAGQYFELMYSADDTNVQMIATAAAAPAPASPSIIVTVNRISQG